MSSKKWGWCSGTKNLLKDAVIPWGITIATNFYCEDSYCFVNCVHVLIAVKLVSGQIYMQAKAYYNIFSQVIHLEYFLGRVAVVREN